MKVSAMADSDQLNIFPTDLEDRILLGKITQAVMQVREGVLGQTQVDTQGGDDGWVGDQEYRGWD